jgi:hypothetical protein
VTFAASGLNPSRSAWLSANMTIDRIIFAVAGSLVLLGVALGLLVSPWFFAIPGFVGANMLQSAFTGFCPLAVILRKAGMPESACFRRASQS